MDASRFDAATRIVGRRGILRALAALAVGVPLALRARFAGAQAVGYCSGTGGICTYGVPCCDGTPCPMNLNPWVGVCGGGALDLPEDTTDGPEPDDGEALPHRQKLRKRRESRRAYRQRRKRGRNKRHNR